MTNQALESKLTRNWKRTLTCRLLCTLVLCGLGLSAAPLASGQTTYPDYTATTPVNHPYAPPGKTVLADFNGDGIADLATAGSNSSGTYLQVYLGKRRWDLLDVSGCVFFREPVRDDCRPGGVRSGCERQPEPGAAVHGHPAGVACDEQCELAFEPDFLGG